MILRRFYCQAFSPFTLWFIRTIFIFASSCLSSRRGISVAISGLMRVVRVGGRTISRASVLGFTLAGRFIVSV